MSSLDRFYFPWNPCVLYQAMIFQMEHAGSEELTGRELSRAWAQHWKNLAQRRN